MTSQQQSAQSGQGGDRGGDRGAGPTGKTARREGLYSFPPRAVGGRGMTGQKLDEQEALASLLQATALGDRQAFARVYALAGPRLFSIALRMLQRRDAAEDVLQESFVAIWQKASQYETRKGIPIAWMASIVRHRVIDRLRAEQRRPRANLDLQEMADTLDAGRPRHEEEGEARVRDCVDELAATQRKALIMAYYYGLTHEELAGHLDAPLGTVKSWVRRGLVQLKECVER